MSIAAQAEALERVLRVDVAPAIASLKVARRIWLVGTGTSQHAAELGAWMFAESDREAHAISAASFAWCQRRLGHDDAVLVISHTTETAFAQRARVAALGTGARPVSITGPAKDWPEAIETVSSETSDIYTVSYTAALIVLARLAVALGRPGFDSVQLSEIPDRVREAAGQPAVLETVPERAVVLAGAGPGAITAREGALKLREAARILAEGYEAEYLLHGSAVPLDGRDALIAIQPSHDSSHLLVAIAATAVNQGLLTVTVNEPAALPPALAQIPLAVRLQVLASHLADVQGIDPDKVIVAGWEDDRLWKAGSPTS